MFWINKDHREEFQLDFVAIDRFAVALVLLTYHLKVPYGQYRSVHALQLNTPSNALCEFGPFLDLERLFLVLLSENKQFNDNIEKPCDPPPFFRIPWEIEAETTSVRRYRHCVRC